MSRRSLSHSGLRSDNNRQAIEELEVLYKSKESYLQDQLIERDRKITELEAVCRRLAKSYKQEKQEAWESAADSNRWIQGVQRAEPAGQSNSFRETARRKDRTHWRSSKKQRWSFDFEIREIRARIIVW